MNRHALHRRLCLVGLALLLGATGCMRPDDSAGIHNHFDHPVEYWSVFDDGRLHDHHHGRIPEHEARPLVLAGCLHPAERVEIRHPDGRVLAEHRELCRGDRWDVGLPEDGTG